MTDQSEAMTRKLFNAFCGLKIKEKPDGVMIYCDETRFDMVLHTIEKTQLTLSVIISQIFPETLTNRGNISEKLSAFRDFTSRICEKMKYSAEIVDVIFESFASNDSPNILIVYQADFGGKHSLTDEFAQKFGKADSIDSILGETNTFSGNNDESYYTVAELLKMYKHESLREGDDRLNYEADTQRFAPEIGESSSSKDENRELIMEDKRSASILNTRENALRLPSKFAIAALLISNRDRLTIYIPDFNFEELCGIAVSELKIAKSVAYPVSYVEIAIADSLGKAIRESRKQAEPAGCFTAEELVSLLERESESQTDSRLAYEGSALRYAKGTAAYNIVQAGRYSRVLQEHLEAIKYGSRQLKECISKGVPLEIAISTLVVYHEVRDSSSIIGSDYHSFCLDAVKNLSVSKAETYLLTRVTFAVSSAIGKLLSDASEPTAVEKPDYFTAEELLSLMEQESKEQTTDRLAYEVNSPSYKACAEDCGLDQTRLAKLYKFITGNEVLCRNLKRLRSQNIPLVIAIAEIISFRSVILGMLESDTEYNSFCISALKMSKLAKDVQYPSTKAKLAVAAAVADLL